MYSLSLHDALPIWLADANIPENAPLVMEIGFGNGDFLVHLAQTHPDWLLVGVEIYLPGVAKAVCRLEDAGVIRSEEHTYELQSHSDLVCRLLLKKKKSQCDKC